MRYFIESLLKADSHALAEQWEVTIRLALDTQAKLCYEQIECQVAQRCRGKKNKEAVQQKLRLELLAVSFTQALSTFALRDPKIYNLLTQAAERWCPWSVEVQQSGRLMQQVLLSVLPDVRKKQALEALCHDYKDHLKKDIEDHLKSDHPPVYAKYQKAEPRVFGAPPFENGEKRAFSISSECQLMERFVAEQASELSHPSKVLAGAIQKYQAVSTLEAALKTPIKSAVTQLSNFRRELTTQQPVIIQDRDSWAIKFAKGVATVLSLGLAAWLGIWGVQGQKAVNEMRDVLTTSTSPSARRRKQ
jgi:hypothetical protein